MKTLYFIICTLLIVAFAACKKDNDCIAPDLASNIVGSWVVSVNYYGERGDVEFKADGTLIDPSHAILGAGFETGLTAQRFYEVTADTLLYVNAYDNVNFINDIEYHVLANTCNEIKLDYLGLVKIMTRK